MEAKLTDHELLSYCAGFFDGEGTIGKAYYDLGVPTPSIEINQILRKPLLLFERWLSDLDNKVYVDAKPTKSGIPMWRYRIGSKEGVSKILTGLYPYLQDVVKKEKAKAVLDLLDQTAPKPVEIDKAFYFRGFFDAEGSISIGIKNDKKVTRSQKLRITVKIQQCNTKILKLFFGAFGSYLRFNKVTDKGTDRFEWIVNLTDMGTFCELISVYSLVKFKRLKWLKALRKIKLSNAGGDRNFKEKLEYAVLITLTNSDKGNKKASKVLQRYLEEFGSYDDLKRDAYEADDFTGITKRDLSRLHNLGFCVDRVRLVPKKGFCDCEKLCA